MAKNNIQMPSGMAGLTRFSNESKSKIQIHPHHVIVLVVIVALLVLLLHVFGDQLFGVNAILG